MRGPARARLRLKWPDGCEFEAEGAPEFVAAQCQRFEAARGASQKPAAAPEAPRIDWTAITETRGCDLQLRAKLPRRSEKEACLVLLAACQALFRQPKPTATQLAKWLRASGYPILRMDRALRDAVLQGEILSSGSRRSRRYELTTPGRLKALLLAEQLGALVSGRPSA